jgi:branched-chain amino acid transport system permease protein
MSAPICLWILLTLTLVPLAAAPLWASDYWIVLLLTFFLYLAMAQTWNLLAGFSGLVSLGQQSFVGLGGYAVAVLSMYHGVPLWLCIPAAGIVAVLFGLLISFPLFRMRGAYFAVGSWIVAEALGIAFSNWAYVGYGSGLFIRPAYTLSLQQVYYLGMAVGIATIAAVYALLLSSTGLGLMAMRDDEAAAEACGVNVFRCKMICFLLAAFITGIAAAVLYSHQIFIQPYKAFGMEWTVRMVFIVIIGGIGLIEGPIVGALIMVGLQQIFADYHNFSLLFMGVTAIALTLLAPQGIAGLIRRKTGWEAFPLRRDFH